MARPECQIALHAAHARLGGHMEPWRVYCAWKGVPTLKLASPRVHGVGACPVDAAAQRPRARFACAARAANKQVRCARIYCTCFRHKTRWALRLAKVDAIGAFTAPGGWRAKAAAQLPREWLDFESIMCATSRRKLTLEHGPYIARCPSRRIATLVFSCAVRKVGSKSIFWSVRGVV